MISKPQFYFRVAIFFGLVAAVAVGAALVFSTLVLRPDGQKGSHAKSTYEHLNLSAEEQEWVDQVYARFEAERISRLEEFHRLQGELAKLLQEEEEYSERVSDTVKQLHVVHADLQEVSIRRFFAVLDVLPAEKRMELRQLAAEALSQPD